MNKLFEGLGFYPADILLPKNADINTWATVACDQFTSEPEYWEKADEFVGDKPSALRLILPEYKLETGDVSDDIEAINKTMKKYLDEDVFTTYEDSLFYIERTQSDGKIRHGLIGMVDLEDYDFTPGSGALIRATEGTVLSRIPPRVKVRENAPIELPHIMLLIDDAEGSVIEPLGDSCEKLLYDSDLMLGGGHIKCWQISEDAKSQVALALADLCTPEQMQKKYGDPDMAPLLFAVGDGNHSLATAKQCYENAKENVPENKWASMKERYALVEVVNIHDDALKFEPIHRVLFGVDAKKLLDEFVKFYPNAKVIEKSNADDVKAGQMTDANTSGENCQIIDYVYEGHEGMLVIENPKAQLAVGTLQTFLDEYLKTHDVKIDYIHGDDVTTKLGSKAGNMGFILPAMSKGMLFKSIMLDGVLPRKTFSMGHAQDKRYYIEARRCK